MLVDSLRERAKSSTRSRQGVIEFMEPAIIGPDPAVVGASGVGKGADRDPALADAVQRGGARGAGVIEPDQLLALLDEPMALGAFFTGEVGPRRNAAIGNPVDKRAGCAWHIDGPETGPAHVRKRRRHVRARPGQRAVRDRRGQRRREAGPKQRRSMGRRSSICRRPGADERSGCRHRCGCDLTANTHPARLRRYSSRRTPSAPLAGRYHRAISATIPPSRWLWRRCR
jgi:hypothetical protein